MIKEEILKHQQGRNNVGNYDGLSFSSWVFQLCLRVEGRIITKQEQDLYDKNYKPLMKEIKEDLNKWKDTLRWIGTLNTVKMLIWPKLIYRFNVISIKIAARFFCIHRQDYSNVYMKINVVITKTTWKRRPEWVIRLLSS